MENKGTKIEHCVLSRQGNGHAFNIPKPYIQGELVKPAVKYTLWIIEEKGDEKT